MLNLPGPLSKEVIIKLLSDLAGCELPLAEEIVPRDGTLQAAKYHHLLDEECLAHDYASLKLSVKEVYDWLRYIM
ncbi:hypothetical protein GGR27_002500 [Lewinella antarctica]|uniref:Uncharacterized protein n=2 Tax=Neolewinella antarctica TaxID=442734 RepID=A0ABX0XE07_9BACT|nr:hypothetical protein [Neolewinella antarctica]